MATDESVIRLRNIDLGISRMVSKLQELHEHFMKPHRYPQFSDRHYGWDVARSGIVTIYSKEVTLAGSTQTETLPLGNTLLLFQHIYMSFNSANARTYNMRAYNAKTATLYTTLDTVTGHTSDSRIVQLGAEHRSKVHKLEWNFSNYTAGDIINIEVQVEES